MCPGIRHANSQRPAKMFRLFAARPSDPQIVRWWRLTFSYNTNSRLAAQYTESVSQRKVPVETRKPTHASANSSCEFATNMARERTMLAKERTVTHKKSEKTLEEVGSSAVGEGSAKYSFQR